MKSSSPIVGLSVCLSIKSRKDPSGKWRSRRDGMRWRNRMMYKHNVMDSGYYLVHLSYTLGRRSWRCHFCMAAKAIIIWLWFARRLIVARHGTALSPTNAKMNYTFELSLIRDECQSSSFYCSLRRTIAGTACVATITTTWPRCG